MSDEQQTSDDFGVGISEPAPSPEPEMSPGEELFASMEAEASATETPVESPEMGQETAESSEPAPPSLLDRVAELGFENVENDQQAIDRLIQNNQQFSGREQLLQKEVEQQKYDLAVLRERQAQATQPQNESAAPESPQGWWNPPAYDEAGVKRYLSTVQNQETGETEARWAKDTPVNVRAEYEAKEAYHSKFAQDLVYRPQEVLPGIIESIVKPMLEQHSQGVEQRGQQDLAMSEIHANESLWQKDPVTGRPAVDATGNPIANEMGSALFSQMQELAASGITDVATRYALASRLTNSTQQGQQLTRDNQLLAAKNTAANTRAEFSQSAAQSLPSQAGQVSPPENQGMGVPDPEKSAGEMFADILESQGFSFE